MSSSLSDQPAFVMHHIVMTIMGGLLMIFILWSFLYWLTWTTGKECVARAMTDVQTKLRANGVITENQVKDAIFSYCTGDGFTGYEIEECKPGFDTYAQYLGQPMYVEVEVTYHVFMKDIKIHGRADIGNGGHYGNGYNTKSQV